MIDTCVYLAPSFRELRFMKFDWIAWRIETMERAGWTYKGLDLVTWTLRFERPHIPKGN